MSKNTQTKLNPYQILNLEKTANDNQIKKAYKKNAMLWHPDKNKNNPEAEDKFKEISAAYDILSDENKRRCTHKFCC